MFGRCQVYCGKKGRPISYNDKSTEKVQKCRNMEALEKKENFESSSDISDSPPDK